MRLQFFLPPTPVLGSVHSATVGGSLAWIQNPAARTRNLIRDRSSILGQVAEFRHQVAPTYRKCAPYSLTSVTLGGLFETIAKPALCGTLPAPHTRRPEQVWGADRRSPRSGGDGPGENYASSELRTDVPHPNARPQKRDAASSLPRPETRGLTLSARASGPLLAATGIIGPLEARRMWGCGVVGPCGWAEDRVWVLCRPTEDDEFVRAEQS